MNRNARFPQHAQALSGRSVFVAMGIAAAAADARVERKMHSPTPGQGGA